MTFDFHIPRKKHKTIKLFSKRKIMNIYFMGPATLFPNHRNSWKSESTVATTKKAPRQWSSTKFPRMNIIIMYYLHWNFIYSLMTEISISAKMFSLLQQWRPPEKWRMNIIIMYLSTLDFIDYVMFSLLRHWPLLYDSFKKTSFITKIIICHKRKLISNTFLHRLTIT